MDNPETFLIQGREISQKRLEQIWEELKKDLIERYPFVSEIKMPCIKAYVVDSKPYMKLQKRLLASSHIRDKALQEWGAPGTPDGSSAAAFYSDVAESWVIIKRKDYGYPLARDLRHELLHIYESIMLLNIGDLTAKSI